MSAHVVLVHGLWYGPAAMWPLARALQRQGYAVSRFGYPAVSRCWSENVIALQQHLHNCARANLHIIAHSLGGLLALAALADRPAHAAPAPPAVVQLQMLGTPVAGSASAKKLLQSPLTARTLGHSGTVLAHGLATVVPGVARHCRLVMYAGCRPFGLGRLVAPLSGAHDGTVAVCETLHPALHAHSCVPCSHSGLLLSQQLRDKVLHTLREAASTS